MRSGVSVDRPTHRASSNHGAIHRVTAWHPSCSCRRNAPARSNASESGEELLEGAAVKGWRLLFSIAFFHLLLFASSGLGPAANPERLRRGRRAVHALPPEAIRELRRDQDGGAVPEESAKRQRGVGLRGVPRACRGARGIRGRPAAQPVHLVHEAGSCAAAQRSAVVSQVSRDERAPADELDRAASMKAGAWPAPTATTSMRPTRRC